MSYWKDKLEKVKSKETNFKFRFLFNLSCLFRAKPLFIFSALYIATSFLYPLICFFLEIQLASISWIYILTNAMMILLIQIISVFILYIENKTNSVDAFFTSKGYTNMSSFIIKTLAINAFIFVLVTIQTFFMIIFMAVFRFQSSISQFFMVNFFGVLIFSLLIFPIFACFSLLNSRIWFAICAMIIVLLPFSSLASRFFPIDTDSYTYNGINRYNYVTSYDFSTKKNTSLSVANSNSSSEIKANQLLQESPVFTPYMPGEILLSPFNVLYQVNTGFNFNGLNNISSFQTNINRPNFIIQGDKYSSSGNYLYRPLDKNIVVCNDSELRKLIVYPFIEFYFETYKEINYNQSDIAQLFDVRVDNKLLFKMNDFISENPSVFYFYRIAQIYNLAKKNSNLVNMPSLETFVEDKIYAIVDSIKCSTSPSFGLFVQASIVPQNTTLPSNTKPDATFVVQWDTILDPLATSNTAFHINKNFPYASLASVNYYEPINDSDYLNFITSFINQTNFENGLLEVPLLNGRFAKIYIVDELKKSPLFSNTGENLQPNGNTAIEQFINSTSGYDKTMLGNPDLWDTAVFKLWNAFVRKRYYWFSEYVHVLQKVANNTKLESSPILTYYSLNPNTKAGEIASLNVLTFGQIVYTPFNQNIWFGFALMAVISLNCWIALFLINKKKK